MKDVRDQQEMSHARREEIEAGFRRRASAEDEKKSVQNKSEVSDERCDERKDES